MLPSRALFTRFHEFCHSRRLIAPGARIVVAVSGGVDSTVLLDLLAEERKQMGLHLVVAHVNHQLRGAESDGDERFVRDLAARYGCDVHVERTDTAGVARDTKAGIQETARMLRYGFFERLRVALGYHAVATAHNAGDNAETVLLHLFRGAGLKGLAGIPVERNDGTIIRPLLFAGRSEIEAYASAREISFRNDSSNATDHYTRNILRHHILPGVKAEINPSVEEALFRSSALFRELDAFLQEAAGRLAEDLSKESGEDGVLLLLDRLQSVPVVLQQYLVRLLVERETGNQPDQTTVESLLALGKLETGSHITLPEGWIAARDRDRLVIRRQKETPEVLVRVVLNQPYALGMYRFTAEELPTLKHPAPEPGRVEYVDADRAGTDGLVVRTWREGDWFIPLGMEGRKKVSDFLIDARVPLFRKKEYPVLTTAAGDVVWLCGQRIDHRFRLTDTTRRILKLVFTPIVSERNHAPGNHGEW